MSEEAEEVAVEPVRAVAMRTKKVLGAKPMRRAAMPAKGMPKKASPRTVKGKIAAIQSQMKENQEATAKIQSGVRAIQSDIKDKTEVFQKAVAHINVGVRAIQSAISEQMKENQAYVRDFYG